MAGGRRRFTLLLLLGLCCAAHAMPQKGEAEEETDMEETENENEVEITTPYGLMKGLKMESDSEDDSTVHHYRFLGIPYAEPPVDELRFREPVPIQPWQGVMNATEFGNKCPQPDIFSENEDDHSAFEGDEDCLFLNIFTPRLPVPRKGKVVPPKSSLLPVMVYVHGGGFIIGDGNVDPTPLLQKDVVVVTLNYRLGALGFLALDNHMAAGNQGLKDQLEAFRWVSNNIIAFGGDPSKVTIFGVSAGGMSVHYHQMSPHGEGLYQGVIAMSGNGLMGSIELVRRNTEADSAKLITELGCESSYDPHSVIRCIQGKNVSELFNITSIPVEENDRDLLHDDYGDYRWAPVVDGDFLPEHPVSILKSGRQKDLPLITGVTADEGALFVGSVWDKFEEAAANFTDFGPKWFFRTRGSDEATEEEKLKSEVLRRFYMNAHEFSPEFSLDMIDMMGDAWFNFPTYKSLQLQSKTQQSPVFMYQVTHAPSHSWGEIFHAKSGADKEDFGVQHGDDMFYLFNWGEQVEQFSDAVSTEEDKETRDKMTTLWANFAEHQDPTPYTDGEIVAWHSFTDDEDNFMEIQEEPVAQKDFHKARMFLWEKLVWEDLEEMVDQSGGAPQPPAQPRALPGIRTSSHISQHQQQQQYHQQPASTNRLPGGAPNSIAFGARPTFTNANFFNTPYFT